MKRICQMRGRTAAVLDTCRPTPTLTDGRRRVKIVILGCGRVGSTLATMMDRAGHTVSIIDYSSDAFQRLAPQFKGETIVGNGVDEEILIRAGIKDADAFA